MSEHRSVTALVIDASGSELVVAGVPLLLRAVLSAWRAGIDRVIVLCDGESRRACEILQRDARTRAVEIVTPDQLDVDIKGPVMLVASNCLVTAPMIQGVAESEMNDHLVGLRDDDGETASFAIVAGAPEVAAALVAARVAERRHAVLRTARGDKPRGYTLIADPRIAIGSNRAVRVHSDADVRRAEAALFAELRAATADTDGPVARLDRALSLRLSGWLVHTPLRPNHITAIGTCIGLLAAWALAQGSYVFGLIGALLFWVAVIIDGCDGEVARLKFLESRFGALFDIITDNVVHVAIFAGLAVGAHRAGHVENVSLFAATLIAGFLCASAATYFCLLSDGPVKRLETVSPRSRLRRRWLRFFEALMNRDFAYLVVALAVVGRLHWFLWGTVFGTYVYALALLSVYRLSDDSASPRGSVEPIGGSPS